MVSSGKKTVSLSGLDVYQILNHPSPHAAKKPMPHRKTQKLDHVRIAVTTVAVTRTKDPQVILAAS